MKTRVAKFLIFLFTVIIMGMLGGLYSLIFAGAVGGTALSLIPKFSFELVGRYVCPAGSHLQYETSQSATPGAPDNSYSINCITQDGTVIQGMKPRAISSVFGLYFLLCFIPTYLPGAILLWIFINRKFPMFFDKGPAPVDD